MRKATLAIALLFILLAFNPPILNASLKDPSSGLRSETAASSRSPPASREQLKDSNSGSFFEDFERGITGWRRDPSGLGRTLRFDARPKPSPVYEGTFSLIMSGKTSQPKQASQVRWVYDLSDRRITVEPELRLSFAWRFQEKRFSYIGLYLLFSDGRGGYYASYFYGSYSNDTKTYMYQYSEPENTWIMHEREVYHDYRKAFGDIEAEVKIVAVGLILADTYATGTQQTTYYDSISIAPETAVPNSFAVYIEPTSQKATAGGTVIFAVSVAPIGEYKDEVLVNVTGVPSDAASFLSAKSGFPPFTSNLLVTLGASLQPGTYPLLVTASDKQQSKSTNATLIVTPRTRFLLEVAPLSQIVTLGRSTSFQLSLRATDLYGLVPVNLSVAGLPRNTTYKFNPDSLTVPTDTHVNSTLVVETTDLTPPGIYPIQVTATDRSDGSADSITVMLIVSSASFTITVTPDKPTYSQGEVVIFYGSVRDFEDLPARGGSVSIQILNPSGSTVHVASATTNRFGQYSDNFTLTSEATVGTYTVFVTATVPGYQDSYNQVTFTVGESLTPSITIVAVYLTDPAGLNRSGFRPGETAVVRVIVQNGGAELKKGMIWVEVDNPDGVPISVTFVETTIGRGGTVTVGVSTTLAESSVSGYYNANSYVSDKMISQGGKFFANAKTIFQVF